MSRALRLSVLGLAAILAGCSVAGGGVLEPVPGSITYGGQPRTKLTKSPIGSTFSHDFRDRSTGQRYVETYRIRPDRSLEIISRRLVDVDIVRNRG